MPKSLRPIAIAPILNGLTHDLGLEKGLAFIRLEARWEEVVGPQVAAHTSPLEIRFDTLSLLVDSAAWMHQLSFLKKELIEKSNALLGGTSIQKLYFKMGPLPPPDPAPRPDKVTAIEAYHPKEAALLDSHLLSIADPELKEVIRRAMWRLRKEGDEERGTRS